MRQNELEIHQLSIDQNLKIQTLKSSELELENIDSQEAKAKEEDDSERTNCSKEFLKFSRKLAKMVMQHLQKKTGLLINMLTFSAQTLEYLFVLYGATRPLLTDIMSLQIYCLERLWNNFKEMISYSKNKKICIVKSDDWNKIYDRATFAEAVKEILAESEGNFLSVNPKLISQLEQLSEPFSKLLFYSNLLFSFTLIMKDSSTKGIFLRSLRAIDNFLVMIVSPELYKNYNHRSGKFAMECCGKCKVCRSRNVSPSFPLQLERGRTKSDLLKTFISITFPELEDISDEKVFLFFNIVAHYM
eukprot:CAMPEP_0176405836 /NCGR_PEP_ID=MMETSP0127-20121128/555_1 /TAXON_ID=938130 /ORGANISM="Platyophrya macrostoma, Strain WH" /LENGTH=301 /DNA_ID=CAMNT_0017784931 /DNA_START=70 /DNA_END=975 /DNA_ORIENTATION=-